MTPHQAQALHGSATIAQLYISALKANRTALASVGDGIAYSYAELARQSCRMARLFRAKGLQRQDAIAFLVGNRAREHHLCKGSRRWLSLLTPAG